MFQVKPELLEIIEKYKELIKNSQFTGALNVAKYTLMTFLVIIALSISCCIISVIITSIFKKIKNLENFFNKATDYLFVISLLPFVIAIIFWCQTGDIQNQIANSVVKEYNIKHENNNPLKEFDEKWLKELLINPKVKTTTLFKPKDECVCREDVNPPSVKYMQIEPAQDDDAPVGKTRITNQIEIKNEAPKQTKHKTLDEVQLIKIENLEGKTFITAYIKIKDKWHKVQIQDALLDDMLNHNTEFYFDKSKNELVVSV